MNRVAAVLIFLPLLIGCSSAGPRSSRNIAEAESNFEIRCGVRFGTAGEASLVNSFNEVLTLAVQGGDQTLLNQMDNLITNGSQLGQRYCVKVQMEFSSPKAIVDAAEVREICGYRYGRGTDASLVSTMKYPEELVDLSMVSNGKKTLLRQLDSMIEGGSQIGKRYCVEGRIDNRNTVIEILGAREF